MLFTDFTAGGKEYKLRLSTRATVELEKKLGCNPLGIFKDEETLPSVTDMVYVLHAAMQQMHHGVSLANAMDIFDAWLADGHVVTDFIPVILDIYKCSGIISDTEAEESEKN
jgi:hypothetical protein